MVTGRQEIAMGRPAGGAPTSLLPDPAVLLDGYRGSACDNAEGAEARLPYARTGFTLSSCQRSNGILLVYRVRVSRVTYPDCFRPHGPRLTRSGKECLR